MRWMERNDALGLSPITHSTGTNTLTFLLTDVSSISTPSRSLSHKLLHSSCLVDQSNSIPTMLSFSVWCLNYSTLHIWQYCVACADMRWLERSDALGLSPMTHSFGANTMHFVEMNQTSQLHPAILFCSCWYEVDGEKWSLGLFPITHCAGANTLTFLLTGVSNLSTPSRF